MSQESHAPGPGVRETEREPADSGIVSGPAAVSYQQDKS